MSTTTTYYFGKFMFEGLTSIKQYDFGEGYFTGSASPTQFHYYIRDHQGNNRVVANYQGTIEQTTHYYPYGGILSQSANQGIQKFKYNGKEFDRMHGLDMYDFGARQQDPETGMFTSMDPMCEKYYNISPYAYCMGNPIRYVDPDGSETHVKRNDDGTYEVIGGVLNDDLNIYVYTTDKNGEYTVKGKSIGVTETTTAFYNSDKNTWATGATIDPNDQSGMNFLEKMESLSVTLDDYIDKARNDHPYDFKVTNGTNGVVSRDIKYQYRGMSIGKNETGQNIYTSARDVGNIAAGIVAAKNGISWLDARLAFDVYQSYSSRNLEMEGLSTQSAQLYGWLITSIKTPPLLKTVNRGASLISTFKKIFNTLF